MKHMMKWMRGLLLSLVLFSAAGCRTAVEPVTGRSQFILTSPQVEMSMGVQAWEDILKREQLSGNNEYTAAVDRVGSAIAGALSNPGFEWEFRVFASEQANAFCLPGGKVGVYAGLFEFVDNDAELAAVVGHEIGHAVARHGGERMTQALLVNLGALGLSVAKKDDENRDRWLLAYTGVTAVGYLLPYSRVHEYSADKLGMLYMARAGYDPEYAISFWRKFSKNSKMPAALEFLSTHPVGEKRMRELEEFYPKAVLDYEIAEQQFGAGVVYQKKESSP